MVDAQEGKKVTHKVVEEPIKASSDIIQRKKVEKDEEITKVDKSVPEDSERPIRRRRKVSE